MIINKCKFFLITRYTEHHLLQSKLKTLSDSQLSKVNCRWSGPKIIIALFRNWLRQTFLKMNRYFEIIIFWDNSREITQNFTFFRILVHYIFFKAFFAPLHRNIHSFLGQEKSAIIDYSLLPFLRTWQKISNKYVLFKKNNTYESLYCWYENVKKILKILWKKREQHIGIIDSSLEQFLILDVPCDANRKVILQSRKNQNKNYAWFSDWQIGAQFADWQKVHH